MKRKRLSSCALQEVVDVVKQTKEEAENSNVQFVKLKDDTIKQLVDYGVANLPMLERVGHVRENILTEDQAKKLGFSTKNKHFHGLGVKTYLEIINSIEIPEKIYQYVDNNDNFIVKTSIKINGLDCIVPVEINKRGQYNSIEIDYNKIKSVYKEDKTNYINNLIKKGKIKEIFTGQYNQQTPLNEIFTQSNSEQTSLTANNISQYDEYFKYLLIKNENKFIKQLDKKIQENIIDYWILFNRLF